MKKSISYLLFIFLISFNSCSENEDSPELISTDISVTTSTNSITWSDQDDLNQQLQGVISFNFGTALESEVITEQTFNSAMSEVITTISFRPQFQNVYRDSNPLNNSVTITLIQNVITPAVVLKADGPGNTYNLITSVLAPGHNPIEVPDCNHMAFGDHIDEVFDNELNTNVFQFYIHTTPDNDRCINFDRQRNEIKSYNQSPDNLLGVQGETVVYKWKFKLPSGFQSSPNFTHLHQLKSVGGDLDAMPMYTLTTRKGTPDKLQLRYAETDTQITIDETSLAPFIDAWVEVTETITYGTSGTYEIQIKKISDNSILLSYSNSNIINWRVNADFVRPKWGIYRSLINDQDLRDETVLFDDFSVQEL